MRAEAFPVNYCIYLSTAELAAPDARVPAVCHVCGREYQMCGKMHILSDNQTGILGSICPSCQRRGWGWFAKRWREIARKSMRDTGLPVMLEQASWYLQLSAIAEHKAGAG